MTLVRVDWKSNPHGQQAAAHCAACGSAHGLTLVVGELFHCRDPEACAERLDRRARRERRRRERGLP